MTAAERKQKTDAAGLMLAQAHAYERRAERELTEARTHRLRGQALVLRGSAWLMQAEVMEGEAS